MSFVSIKKLKGSGIVAVAAKHNLRELQAELGAGGGIDASKIRLNRIMTGPCTSGEVAALAVRLMTEGGIDAKALRKDAVMGLELVISLPADFRGNADGFFADSLTWCAGHFNVQVLSAVIHLDEAIPHCHIVLLPLLNGKMTGSAMVGGRAQLLALHESFHKAVGARHGLPKLAGVRHSPEQRRDIALDCLRALTEDVSVLFEDSAVRLALVGALTKDPLLMASALGLKIPDAGKKSFVERMTAPVACKEARSKVTAKASSVVEKANPIGFDASPNPIGFVNDAHEIEQSICSVGFASDSPSNEADFDHEQDDFTRCSDDFSPSQWDEVRGEFVTLPASPKGTVRASASREIQRALQAMRH